MYITIVGPEADKKARLKGHAPDPYDVRSEDLQQLHQGRQAFANLFPDFQTGVTPARSINSNMSTEEQNRLLEEAERKNSKQKLFNLLDIQSIKQRQAQFQDLMGTR